MKTFSAPRMMAVPLAFVMVLLSMPFVCVGGSILIRRNDSLLAGLFLLFIGCVFVLFAANLACEKIEISEDMIIHATVFGKKKINISEVIDVRRELFGRGNSILIINSRRGITRMCTLLPLELIDEIVEIFNNKPR